MQIGEARMLFRTGYLTSCQLVRYPMDDGYLMQISTKEGATTLQTKRGASRSFRSIDTACQVAADIGFDRVTVFIRSGAE